MTADVYGTRTPGRYSRRFGKNLSWRLTLLAAVGSLGTVLAPIAQAVPTDPGNQPARGALPDAIETATIDEIADALVEGKISSVALVERYLQRIEAIDRTGPSLHSIIAVMPDAIEQARQRDEERAAGTLLGALHGIPILLKDNIEAAGPLPTTAGSTALISNITNRDAPLVARLKAQGAIILGKANLSQWANMRADDSTSGWSSVGGLVRNPHALNRNVCGSSSGSAAAAAAALAAGTVGTETDGSITCPASINGVVGFKPTVGLVSRTLVIPISHTQDTAGPITRGVKGAAIMLTAMAGFDAQDPATRNADAHSTDFSKDLSSDSLEGRRIGVLRDRLGDDPRVIGEFERALKVLESAGAVLVDIKDSAIDREVLGEAEFQVLLSEFKVDLNRYLASTPEAVKTRTLADLIAFNRDHADTELRWMDQAVFEQAQSQNGLDDPVYMEALATSQRLAGPEGIDRLLAENGVEMLVAPSNGPAWVSDLLHGDGGGGPSQSQLPAIAGYPHLTVPMGMVEGLPVGISFIGPKWSDHMVLKAGYAYEQASHERKMPRFPETVPVAP